MKILLFSLYCWFLASQEGVSWQGSCPWSPRLEHLAPQEPSGLENTAAPESLGQTGKHNFMCWLLLWVNDVRRNESCVSSAPCPPLPNSAGCPGKRRGYSGCCSRRVPTGYFLQWQERGNVRIQGLWRSHMIYAFSFGCVFLWPCFPLAAFSYCNFSNLP